MEDGRGAAAFDVVVLGGGSAGCAVAGRLSEDPARTVCLVEAGPDYGHSSEGRWPADLLDASAIPRSHDWDPSGAPDLARARVLGGCSAHNGCWCVRPPSADLAEWASVGGLEWAPARVAQALELAEAALAVRTVAADELGPWQLAALEAAQEVGFELVDDLPRTDEPAAGCPAVNAVAGVRWNTAFAYLDAARSRPNLTILSRSLVDRLHVRRGRVREVSVVQNGRARRVSADTVVLCAGAYGTPTILLRSGIGPEGELRRQGIVVEAVLDGVGANLVDHAGVGIFYGPLDPLAAATDAHLRARPLVHSQALIKARSSLESERCCDVFLVPISARVAAGRGGRARLDAHVQVFAMKPRSRGRVRLRSPDPGDEPEIEQALLSDPEGADLAVLLEGIDLARELAATGALSAVAGAELMPDIPSDERAELEEWAREAAHGYWHPVGTCAMGDPSDPLSVADAAGKVHALENVFVADASLLPTVPRTNPNLSVVAAAELLARGLDERLRGRSASGAPAGRPAAAALPPRPA